MFPETFLSQPAAYFEWSTEEKIEQKNVLQVMQTSGLQICNVVNVINSVMTD